MSNQPASYRIDILIMIALFLGALGLFSSDWVYYIGDGVSTVGGERVLQGQIPYRDFWTMYAPGQFYLVAMLFRMFGAKLFVEVVAASVVCAAAACVNYRLACNLVGRRLPALASAGIFVAAMYNTGYFRRLGSYPPTILFIFVALNLVSLYYNWGKLRHLLGAGVATGLAVTFKHDVGGYTAIAIVAGLIAHQFLGHAAERKQRLHSLILQLVTYAAGAGFIVIPPLIYFSIVAGPDMLRDLIIFPLTDFRFARPESYPSLIPTGIADPWRSKMLFNFFAYLNFTIPFALLLLGLVAIGLALHRGKPRYVATGITFTVGFLLHYAAAHVQINTHIITLSAYAALLGVIFYDLAASSSSAGRPAFAGWLFAAVTVGWCVSLAADQGYGLWKDASRVGPELQLAKVSGFVLQPQRIQVLTELSSFVDSQTSPHQELFVGVHRHDYVGGGDTMIYFILNRPPATRYQELHPAIVDTAEVQREIISDLQRKNIPLIIRKDVSTDERIDRAKADLIRHVPRVGATDLDKFIQEHYIAVRKFGPYAVWKRKALVATDVRARAFDNHKLGGQKLVSSTVESLARYFANAW